VLGMSVILVACSNAYAQLPLPPLINSAGSDGTVLTINGANFGGSGVPKVTLNSTELVIQTATATTITAALPAALPPAS
jgi:hypothetical protein